MIAGVCVCVSLNVSGMLVSGSLHGSVSTAVPRRRRCARHVMSLLISMISVRRAINTGKLAFEL